MALHMARRAANIGRRSRFPYVEQCVILWLSRHFVVLLWKRSACLRARRLGLDTVWWFMLGCVAFSVYCRTGSAHKCKMRPGCVLNTALDLAAAALCIECGVGET